MLVAGQQIGKVDDIELTDDAQAEVTISVDEPLHEGTTAVDSRHVAVGDREPLRVASPRGPNNSPELEDGATLTGEHTTSPVDLDQLFNTFRPGPGSRSGT